jgi:hypothetical protein
MTFPLGIPLCMAGRIVFFKGRWLGIPPCEKPGRHHITTKDPNAFADLCDEHFEQVLAATRTSEGRRNELE